MSLYAIPVEFEVEAAFTPERLKIIKHVKNKIKKANLNFFKTFELNPQVNLLIIITPDFYELKTKSNIIYNNFGCILTYFTVLCNLKSYLSTYFFNITPILKTA